MNNWRKFWQLPAEERTVLLTALALLPAVRLGLRVLGLRGVRAALAIGRCHGCEDVKLSDTGIRRARRAARLVDVASGFAGGSCLARSIVLARILKSRAIPAQLRIGVRNGERGIEAHAWIETGGIILNDGQDVGERFVAFDRDFALARGSWR